MYWFVITQQTPAEVPLRWTHIYVPISEPRLGDTFLLLGLKPQTRGSLTDEHQACTTKRKQHRNPNNLKSALYCRCLRRGVTIGLVNLGFYGHARVIFLPQGTAPSCLSLPEAMGPPHQLNSSGYTTSKQFYTPSIKSKAVLQVFQALEHMMELRLCDRSQLGRAEEKAMSIFRQVPESRGKDSVPPGRGNDMSLWMRKLRKKCLDCWHKCADHWYNYRTHLVAAHFFSLKWRFK